jgi:hypothetical protein
MAGGVLAGAVAAQVFEFLIAAGRTAGPYRKQLQRTLHDVGEAGDRHLYLIRKNI